jgi:DNA modification methylase
MVKDQLITEKYAIYNSDCMYVLPELESKSIDLSIYSPPFAGLYTYSSSPNDFSNCDSYEKFMDQYEFLIQEISRLTKPGRITAVHCQDVLMNVTKNHLWDFPSEIIKLHLKHGFYFVNRITIWKEPLKVRIRTMVRSLMHKLIVEDSTECFTAQPDYVLLFKKAGENKVLVTHDRGLNYYAGQYPFTIDHLSEYGIQDPEIKPPKIDGKYDYTTAINDLITESFKELQKKYKNHKDQRTNKLSHIIWQRYASAVWDDIRNDNVLKYKESKEEEDEKHVHPLQLDVIDRLVELYSNPGETVLTPFMGVGSEVYSPVSMGRNAIGIELKESYYKQAILNLETVYDRFKNDNQQNLF